MSGYADVQARGSQANPAHNSELLDLAIRATYEVEAIARHLNGALPTEQPEYQHLRSLVVRIFHLNSVVMSALSGDCCRDADEMRSVVRGC